ncbi:magnesium transporter CorA family protein [Acidithiobacillus ferriphilus]|uniref:magnesium transporter CorA family protein n=1 Tax=Acidithiobacillus ferriphilus TaxID=1689834 RepID=UPI002DB83C4F|nr:magnesium transporter CorA family protein [Acidithiobacillus ferriphilus]MEB8535921.1 magnesium transporter CorA family protein [Acidithiobacillus ferriphilus]
MDFIVDQKNRGRIIPLSKGLGDHHRRWIHYVAPDTEELAEMANRYAVPTDFLTSAMDPDERPRLDREGERRLIILKAPLATAHVEGVETFGTVPLGILLLPDDLVTLSQQELPVMEHLLQRLQKKGMEALRLRGLLAEIFQSLAHNFLLALEHINQGILAVETDLRHSQSNDDFFRLVALQKTLTLFSAALRGNIATAQKALHLPQLTAYTVDHKEIVDAIADLQQAREMTEVYASNITNMMDAYIGVLQNNISTTLKVITSWTVVISIPVLVISIYGMNSPLLFQSWPYMWPTLMGGSFLMSGIAAVAFRKWRWL